LERQSALLADPGKLQPETLACDAQPPAVLLDLDPGDERLSLAEPGPPNPALTGALAMLRAQGVTVFWISDNPSAAAAAIRQKLRESGLDPAGEDPLLIQRFPGERKQTRRRELAESHCLVAIAGDVREDFDELYAYIREGAPTYRLEPLVGEGWFITPNPLD
jgi:hypothetical protein